MPSLPFELERMIFERAVLEDTDHDNRVQIALVAKRVYEWTRPIMYRVAIAEKTHLSKGTIRNWRKTQIIDVARFVRHLLTLHSNESYLLEVLSIFRNVENLAIWNVYLPISSEILKAINDLPLRTFSTFMLQINLADAVKNCAAFRNLTHLQLLFIDPQIATCNALVGLPKLTHLSFVPLTLSSVEGELALNLLECCSSLRVLIYHKIKDGVVVRPDFTNISDPRFLIFRNRYQAAREWELSANNGQSFWELADVIVEARRGKLFKDNSLFTFSLETWMDDLNDDGVRWYKERNSGL